MVKPLFSLAFGLYSAFTAAGCTKSESSADLPASTGVAPTPPAGPPQSDTIKTKGAPFFNSWPNPDIQLISDYSRMGKGHSLRVHMEIPLDSISQNLQKALDSGLGGNVLKVLNDEKLLVNATSDEGWATLKAALRCKNFTTAATMC